jgi:hypothetical protein
LTEINGLTIVPGMKGGFSLLALVSIYLCGCASYSINPIAPSETAKWGDAKEGYVFYQPELYFLVTPAGGGKATAADEKGKKEDEKKDPSKEPKAEDKATGLSVTPIYLPNPAKPYRVTTFNFLAKSDFAFNFKDGWQLTSISDKADNTTVANTLAGELKTILGAAGVGIASMKQPVDSFLLHPKYSAAGIIMGFEVMPLPKSERETK